MKDPQACTYYDATTCFNMVSDNYGHICKLLNEEHVCKEYEQEDIPAHPKK